MWSSQKEMDWRDSFLVPVFLVCLPIFSNLQSGGVVRPMVLEKLSKVVLVVSNQSRNHREYRKIVSCFDLHRSLWLPLVVLSSGRCPRGGGGRRKEEKPEKSEFSSCCGKAGCKQSKNFLKKVVDGIRRCGILANA